MNVLDFDYIVGLLNKCDPPCLSLYQPTHRHYPENKQNLIRYRNLVKMLEESLQQKYPKKEIKTLLESFLALAEDHGFWRHSSERVVVLGGRGIFRVFRVQRPIPELAIVADSYHTKPLIRILQSTDRYQVLGLNRQEIKLFEGNRDVLDELELNMKVPHTIGDVLEESEAESHLNVHTYGGLTRPQSPIYHGHGAKRRKLTSMRNAFSAPSIEESWSIILNRQVYRSSWQPYRNIIICSNQLA